MGRRKLSAEDIELRNQIAQNLKFITRGLTQQQISDKTGIPKTTISGYLNATSTIKPGNVEKIASTFKVKKSAIDPRYADSINIENVIPSSEITEIPIIGEIACGAPIFSEQNIVGYLPVIAADVKGGEYFALIAKGDSMNPTIQSGDKVTIRRQPTAENGDIVAACIDGEITLKRFKKIGNQVMLLPDNRDYDPIMIHEGSQSYIVGKAVSSTKTF